MIEAVKSTLVQASFAKAPADNGSSLSSFASDANEVREVAEVPYVSPTVRVDVNTKIAILEFRESSSGDVLIQVPSEQQIRAYQANKARKDAEIEAQIQNTGSSGPDVEVTEAQIEREVQAQQNISGSGNLDAQVASSEA